MDRLLEHNFALQEHFDSVWAIKQALAEENLHDAILYWDEIPDHDKRALWVSPRKGGVFTTAERRILHSDEFSQLRRQRSED